MRVTVEGTLSEGVTSKDVVLHIIGTIGTAGGTGCVIEFAGSVVRSFSMEARMSMCNMSIEGGARAGMIAPDEVTFDYLRSRPLAPKGEVRKDGALRKNPSPTLAAGNNQLFDLQSSSGLGGVTLADIGEAVFRQLRFWVQEISGLGTKRWTSSPYSAMASSPGSRKGSISSPSGSPSSPFVNSGLASLA